MSVRVSAPPPADGTASVNMGKTLGLSWTHIIGAGLLGGIGFTMSLFIAGLSFSTGQFMEFSKLGIIIGSLLAGVSGLTLLWFGSGPAETQTSP